MTPGRRVPLAEGLTRVEIKIRRGNVTIQGVSPGTASELEWDGELDVSVEGDALRCKQVLGLASLLGEQQVRIAIDGNVLLDKRLRIGRSNIRIALPASVGELRCHVGSGDIRLDGVDGDVALRTNTGSAQVSNGRGRVVMKSGAGDMTVSAWCGSVQFVTDKGSLEADEINGEVQATIGTGDVSISGAERAKARSGCGDLAVDRICGETILETGGGHIVATNLMGARLDVRTDEGEIALGGHLAGLKAETGSGAIICRGDLAEGNYELKSGKGDLSLEAAVGGGVRVDAFARHGRVESDLPLITVGTSGPEGYFGKRVVGSIGDGQPKTTIFLRADRGDISLLLRQPENEAVATELEAGQGEDRERMILEAVSRGELTVGEALMLLEESLRGH